jgi:hypothetical protein
MQRRRLDFISFCIFLKPVRASVVHLGLTPFLDCGGLPPLCFDIDLSMSLEGKSWHRQVDAKKKRRQAAALQNVDILHYYDFVTYRLD